MEALADIWYRANGGYRDRENHYNRSRYHALNLHALFSRYHTIETRLGQFCEEKSMDWTVLKSFILICLAMDKKAKSKEKFFACEEQERITGFEHRTRRTESMEQQQHYLES